MIRTRSSWPDGRTIVRRLAASLLPLAILAMAPAAVAQEAESDPGGVQPYVEYMIGFSHMPNQTIKGDNSASLLFYGSTDQEPIGYFVGGALGARFLEAVRAEVQLGFRSSDIDSLAVQGEPDKGKNATLSMFTVMANVYYDLDLREQNVPVIPWAGIGIGWGMPRLDGQNEAGATQLDIDDTDSVLVYNAMVGLSYPLSEISTVNLGYRYIGAHDVKVSGAQSGLAQRFEYEFDAHEVYTGIRFAF